jgi:hypothetical protein
MGQIKDKPPNYADDMIICILIDAIAHPVDEYGAVLK